MALSSSPASIAAYLAYDSAHEEDIPTACSAYYASTADYSKSKSASDPITLAEFVDALPRLLRRQKEQRCAFLQRGTEDDPVNILFRRLDLSRGDVWRKYALFEPMKNYTRNLIATDDETFTLLLLCWNPGKESPIHDHPCDGCWLRVCAGKIRETRYEINDATDELEITSDTVFDDDAPTFINDSMGYHKVGNPSKTKVAVTMHLYCPPFNQCKIWLDPSHASRPSKACMCNYSVYGEVKHTCEMFEVNMI